MVSATDIQEGQDKKPAVAEESASGTGPVQVFGSGFDIPTAAEDRELRRLAERRDRAEVANAFIRIVSEHGRRFFEHEGRVSRFEVDRRGRVWFVDKWRSRRIYTHRAPYTGWGCGFSSGGTLLNLCRELQRYIMGKRDDLPLGLLGPWSADYCRGDLWGYGDDMAAVRERCAALAADGGE